MLVNAWCEPNRCLLRLAGPPRGASLSRHLHQEWKEICLQLIRLRLSFGGERLFAAPFVVLHRGGLKPIENHPTTEAAKTDIHLQESRFTPALKRFSTALLCVLCGFARDMGMRTACFARLRGAESRQPAETTHTGCAPLARG